MKQIMSKTAWIAILVAILALGAAWPCAAQTTFTVTTTGDDATDPATLRGAIAAAADGDTINITAEGTIYVNSPIEVTKSLTIAGPGSEKLAIDGQGSISAMSTGFTWVGGPIPSVTVGISGLTIQNGSGAYGGAITNGSTLTLSNCVITGNVGLVGGAMCNMGTMTIMDCTFNNNVASSDTWSGYPVGFGGAIFNGAAMTLTRCTFSNNSAVSAGGAIINGISLGSGYSSDVTATITGCTFTQNSVTYDPYANPIMLPGGGAIYSGSVGGKVSLTILDSTLSENSAPMGGALLISPQGVEGEFESEPDYPAESTVSIVRSTFSGNSATSDFYRNVFGGAITQAALSPVTAANLTIDNSTISGNTAYSSLEGVGQGGAIVNINGDLAVNNSTIVGNADNSGVSGVYVWNARMRIKNTILANDPSGANLACQDPYYDIITSDGYNLSSDDGSGFLTKATDKISTDPLLGPLADNGGLTQTHALPTGSPAIDAADSTDIAGETVATDQRGTTRPQGSSNDIGAFEFAATNQAPVADAGPNQDVTVPHDGDPATNTASVTLDGSGSSDPDGDALTYLWQDGVTTLGTSATVTVDLAPGTHVITLNVTDPAGLSGTSQTTVTVASEPNQTPSADAGLDQNVTTGAGSADVTLNGAGSSDPDGDSLSYTWTENGIQIATGVSPSVTLTTGTHSITLTVTDPYGATDTDIIVVKVKLTYSWSGVLQPIDPPNASGVSASVFKAGSTVPVKFALTGVSAGITTLVAKLSVAKISNGIVGSDAEAVSTAAATKGNLFRYDATSGQYIFNWSTKGLTSGTYRLTINLGDGVLHTVDLSLK